LKLLRHTDARCGLFDEQDVNIEILASGADLFDQTPLIADALPVLRMPPSDDLPGVARLRNFVGQSWGGVPVQRQMPPPAGHQDDALGIEGWMLEHAKDRHRAWIIDLVCGKRAIERRYAI